MYRKLNTRKSFSYHRFFFFLFALLVLSPEMHAQVKADIEKALAENNTERAGALVQQQVDAFYAARKADSINDYIFYTGKTEQLRTGPGQAIKKVQALIEKIKTLRPPPATLVHTWLEAGEYYGFAGRNQLAYKANQEAYRYALLMPDKTPEDLGRVESNMGTYAQRMGDITLSQSHHRQAFRHFQSYPATNPERLYLSCNNMGSIMWYASRLDSALYFYTKAGEALKKTKPTAENKYYRMAILQNNMAALYGMQGNTTEAIHAMEQCIANLRDFIASKEPSQKKNTAISFQFEAMDNLAGIYKELGNFRQARELLTYSYQQKQQQLNPDDPAIFISQILLGQLYYAMKEHSKAQDLLNQGLDRISRADGDYTLWQADACYTLALLQDEKKNIAQARHFYEKADQLYEASYQGEYDNIYLDFLRNAALFYAENNMSREALTRADKGYQYTLKTQGTTSLSTFYQLLNLSEIHFQLGNYPKALEYGDKGLSTVNRMIRSGTNLLDSIKMELKKPKAILLKARSTYELLTEKNRTALNAILTELDEALNILEKRKSVIRDEADINLLMADHAELIDFTKQILFDLYQTTGLEIYADRLISLHESGMYNRLRARLDKRETLQFAHLPPKITAEERTLKEAISTALVGESNHGQKIQAYITATDHWNNYLGMLRIKYPRYYKMRYASLFKSIKEIQPAIPSGTTVIRYFFTGKNLLALIVDQQQRRLIRLPAGSVEKQIAALASSSLGLTETADILHYLYGQLWKPVSPYIHNNRLIIIPDGILYNLNFEILTPEKIAGFEALATNSLLSEFTISYQYSLFLLGQQSFPESRDRNFVAFTPGFSDEIKNEYRATRKDSSDLDAGYLSLLPQPFTVSLAADAQKLLGGTTFTYDESTLSSFRQQAGGHKIIHIGTHAESNNLHPEFSRLIFAKNLSGTEEQNSLYLFDIYNCDLNADLAVLTACETGRPGYQDGEGMLSLAHAFNYAGSQSIITGLWKIDEQASARLISLFYQNLRDGLPKDAALREAKLSYLASSQGRTLAPLYWAGLVLIGDSTGIDVAPERNGLLLWLAGGLMGVALLVFGVRRISRRRHRLH